MLRGTSDVQRRWPVSLLRPPRHRGVHLTLAISGLYAWSTTVLPCLIGDWQGVWWGQCSATLCLMSLVASVLIGREVVQEVLGIPLTFLFALVAWCSTTVPLGDSSVFYGALAWFIYAMAWGLADAPLTKAPLSDDLLTPRRKMKLSSLIMQSLATLACTWLFSLTPLVTRSAARVFVTIFVLWVGIQLQVLASEWGAQVQLPESKGVIREKGSYFWPVLGLLAGGLCLIFGHQFN